MDPEGMVKYGKMTQAQATPWPHFRQFFCLGLWGGFWLGELFVALAAVKGPRRTAMAICSLLW